MEKIKLDRIRLIKSACKFFNNGLEDYFLKETELLNNVKKARSTFIIEKAKAEVEKGNKIDTTQFIKTVPPITTFEEFKEYSKYKKDFVKKIGKDEIIFELESMEIEKFIKRNLNYEIEEELLEYLEKYKLNYHFGEVTEHFDIPTFLIDLMSYQIKKLTFIKDIDTDNLDWDTAIYLIKKFKEKDEEEKTK